jgi:hypothetical protein
MDHGSRAIPCSYAESRKEVEELTFRRQQAPCGHSNVVPRLGLVDQLPVV